MTDPPRDTVADVLHRQRRWGEKPLVICDEQRLSYAEADTGSSALARRLATLGVGKGTHVGILHPNGPRFVIAALAASRIGAVVVPFSTFSTATELRRQLRDADVAVLLAAKRYRNHDYTTRLDDAVGAHRGVDGALFSTEAPVLRHILFGDDGDDRGGGEPADIAAMENDVDGSDTLAIIYTSGSTSDPKGVIHTHGSLIAHQRNLNEIRGLTDADRLFCNSPFFWIGGFAFGLLATMVAGATLICSDATDAAATLDLIEAEKPTLTNGFVAGVAHLARHPSYPGRDLSTIRRGNLYPLMAPQVRPADPELRHNMLGMTEAGSVVLLSGDESDQPEARRGSYGFLAPGFESRVVDPDTGHDVATGVVGELFLRGKPLMQGYYGRTREQSFDADGWFHSGDLVRRDADGVHYFVGRAGSMIKTAGTNVAPAEVEKALTEALTAIDPSVAVYVVGLTDEHRGQIVAAVVATDTGTVFDLGSIAAVLREQLSAYKIPRRIHFAAHTDIPTLSSGKIDTAALRGLFDE